MPTWPATLPAPLVDGYGIEPVSQTVSTDMEVGSARVRRRSFAQVDMLPVQWSLSNDQMTVFRVWFSHPTGADGGAAWFSTSLLMGDGSARTVQARFAGNWKAGYVPHRRWQVYAMLEVRSEPMSEREIQNILLGFLEKDVLLLWSPTEQASVLASKIGPYAEFSATGVQYDENGVSVGVAPAIHGDKGVWCGPSYANLFTGAIPVAASFTQTDGSGIHRMTENTTLAEHIYQSQHELVVGSRYSVSAHVKADTFNFARIYALTWTAGWTQTGCARLSVNLFTGESLLSGPHGIFQDVTGKVTPVVNNDGWYLLELSFTISPAATAADIVNRQIGLGINRDMSTVYYTGNGTNSVLFSKWQLTATVAPMPYVLPGTTVASAAGTSDGNGIGFAMSAEMTAALSGTCTIAAEVTMGVEHLDLLSGVDTVCNIVAVANTGAHPAPLGYARFANGDPSICRSSDGVSLHLRGAWSRNERHLKIVQTNALGTQFRVGNLRRGIDSAIQWGTWANYDGSFNPLTHLRLAFGTTVPIWIKRVMVSNMGGMSDSQIEERINA